MEQALNDFPGSHINNVFNEGELDKKSVVAKFATSTLTHRAGKAQILFDHMAAHNYEGASIFWVRNVDELTSTSRRIDLGQICSISDHKS